MSLCWSDERYCRLYVRDTPSWLLGPWQARAVLPLVLRKVDRAGTLQLGDDGLEALAVTVGLPLDVVEVGAAWWVKRGTFEIVAGVLVVPNFIDAQEAKASDKKRAAEHRERTRDQARAGTLTSRTVTDRHEVADDGARPAPEPSATPPVPPSSPAVTVTHRDVSITPRDDASRTVADRHADSAGVTLSRAVPCLAVPSQKRDPSASQPFGLTPEDPSRTSKGKAKDASPEHRALVEHFKALYRSARNAEPEIAAKDRIGVNKLLLGRSLDEAKAILDRAFATDDFVREKQPNLAYIAGNVNAYIGAAPKTNGKVHNPIQATGGTDFAAAARAAAAAREVAQ